MGTVVEDRQRRQAPRQPKIRDEGADYGQREPIVGGGDEEAGAFFPGGADQEHGQRRPRKRTKPNRVSRIRGCQDEQRKIYQEESTPRTSAGGENHSEQDAACEQRGGAVRLVLRQRP